MMSRQIIIIQQSARVEKIKIFSVIDTHTSLYLMKKELPKGFWWFTILAIIIFNFSNGAKIFFS